MTRYTYHLKVFQSGTNLVQVNLQERIILVYRLILQFSEINFKIYLFKLRRKQVDDILLIFKNMLNRKNQKYQKEKRKK